jgi:hypothetical protein
MYTLNNNIYIMYLFIGVDIIGVMLMDDKISTFDIENFRVPNNYIRTCPKPPKKPRKPRFTGNFLKGPIPIAWLMKASALPGKAFQTGIVLWYLCGLRKNSTVILANGLLERFHVGRKAKYRGLQALEGAGLIAVEERKDRNPRVTILTAGPEESERQE